MNDRPPLARLSSLAAVLALTAAPIALAGPSRETPRAGTPPPSAPPGAGSGPSTGPEVGTSRNPFHPHSSAMIRQSNRLKARGYVGHVMNDGEIVLALDSARRLMARVEGDYQAHRAKAIRRAIQEVDDAIRHIRSTSARSVAPAATPAGGGKRAPGTDTRTTTSNGPAAPKPTRTPAESDAYLKEAHHELVKLESHMIADGNARRLAPARDLVRKAIEELIAAEEIR